MLAIVVFKLTGLRQFKVVLNVLVDLHASNFTRREFLTDGTA